ncbi:MAG: hypothetical protein Alpg2KO_04620 [Alphaproteobacteria bacterium]
MEINPLSASLAGRIDGTSQRPQPVDPDARRSRTASPVTSGNGGFEVGTVSSLASTSAAEFQALADAGQVNPNAPRGTYLNLLV